MSPFRVLKKIVGLGHQNTQQKAVEMTEHNSYTSLFNTAKYPLLAYGGLAAVYVYQSKASWFSFHPFAMVFSFITLAGNATLLKKIGGLQNTRLHGQLMTVGNIIDRILV